jgi:hypothetical protein
MQDLEARCFALLEVYFFLVEKVPKKQGFRRFA